MVQMSFKISLESVGWLVVISLLFFSLMFFSCKSSKKTKGDQFTLDHIETGVYQKRNYLSKGGRLKYNIIYPTDFDSEKKYPLLLFLHGAGERGDDNEAQLIHGGELIKKGVDAYQFIAVLPQCPKGEDWINVLETENREDDVRDFEPDINAPASYALAMVIDFMESFTQERYINKDKVYVAGLSMGGMGTYDLCWRMPEMFAAANVICGAGSVEKAPVFSNLPIRIFHGNEDNVVSVEQSLEMIEALRKAGGDPEVFIYPEVNHGSWVNAFKEPDFLSWFFDHQKK